MPSKQQLDELLCNGQTASKSQSFVFVIGWVFKSVNYSVIFQLSAFLQVVSSSNVLQGVKSMDCNFINGNFKQSG